MEINVEVPCGESGDWKVDWVEVSKWDAMMSNLRGGGVHSVLPGKYKRLTYRGHCVMSNTQMEIRTNCVFIHRAKGRVLVNGLGLGVVLTAILDKPEVTEVWVIENHEDVIKLVAPTFANEERLKIIHADALTYAPPKGVRFDVVWHDIWTDMCADNLPQMHKLHRKYGKRCDWQGSWSRGLIESRR